MTEQPDPAASPLPAEDPQLIWALAQAEIDAFYAKEIELKRTALAGAVKVLVRIPDLGTRDIYMNYAAQKIGIPVETVRDSVDRELAGRR